ncbi:prepilin-type N-terminal cleavage/methylation domain-containing protein [Candidatus Cryosericum odellii]|jgi:prepilin-type N-terminal cleavage/methylation domain-containing protein|uniref:Prepilin-type N-terminal cleavage/methylation domain-containing protein n=2 Tax=Candidatus Cryosericum odellii TaxID=2290917 RepID=A0A398D1T8_9BACT|nr:prepilin-type N-terminal cleavage/methylation domain-containing protein [Candidatus Cryosericum odellii]RIE08793.1 prepilin-type N-terminal cleavage/methylation domain-containing protein [Candidatus Cryosericum odellii]
MSWYRRLPRTSLRVRRTRSGFTLIELMVALALLVIVTMMAFSGFRYLTAVMNRTITTTTARENLSVVMDQLTKELREVTSVSGGTETNDISTSTPLAYRANYGITLPTWTSASDSSGGLGSVISSPATTPASPTTLAPIVPALGSGVTYTFSTTTGAQPNGIILEFFTIDTSATPAKHRIRYSLTAPMVGSTYAGLAQGFWAVSSYEPCEITYCNNTWKGSSWTTESPQPMTDQVVTAFTVTRPLWSPNVLQITLEAQVPGLGRTGYNTVRLIGLVTVRQ